MKIFTQQLDELVKKATALLPELIDKKGKESQFSNTQVLSIEDENLNYNIEGGRWVIEISASHLIDNKGYQYHFQNLDIDKFFELVDYFND